MGRISSFLDRFRSKPAPLVTVEVVREVLREPAGALSAPAKKRRPSRTNREICERLELAIEPDMDNRDVQNLIQKALSDPELRRLHDTYRAEKAAEDERLEREELGDALYEESRRWEETCKPGVQYLLRFQRGKAIQVDVVEFDFVDVDAARVKSPLKIGVLLPKLKRDREIGPHIDWEKEVLLEPRQILSMEPLANPIDLFDVTRYEDVVRTARGSDG